MMIRVVDDALAHALIDAGDEVVFGLAGDANLFLLEAYRQAGGRYVPTAHEASAVLAALGAASVSGVPGVATVTHGPGLANTIGALIEGVKARLPIVLLTGETPPGVEHLQHIDQARLVAAAGAPYLSVERPEDALPALAAARRRALRESTPVVLGVPTPLLRLPAGAAPVDAPEPPPRPATAALETAVGILTSARRPVVLAGRGAIAARDAVLRLARRLGAPVATTLRARNLFAGEPEDLGISGGLSDGVATGILATADVVVAFGAGLNRWTTDDGSLLAAAAILRVDTAPRTPTPARGVDLVGDAAVTADALIALLDETGIPPPPSMRRSPAVEPPSGRARSRTAPLGTHESSTASEAGTARPRRSTSPPLSPGPTNSCLPTGCSSSTPAASHARPSPNSMCAIPATTSTA